MIPLPWELSRNTQKNEPNRGYTFRLCLDIPNIKDQCGATPWLVCQGVEEETIEYIWPTNIDAKLVRNFKVSYNSLLYSNYLLNWVSKITIFLTVIKQVYKSQVSECEHSEVKYLDCRLITIKSVFFVQFHSSLIQYFHCESNIKKI